MSFRGGVLVFGALAACGARSWQKSAPVPISNVPVANLPSPAPAAPAVSAPPTATPVLVRETATLQVDGQTETWTLRWTRPPVDHCIDTGWFSAPCLGFAYGERGPLVLVRSRAGAPDDVLPLDSLFDGGESLLPHWPTDGSDPFEAVDVAAVKRRPPVSILRFGDYDHDGQATELVLQVATGAFGHRPAVVVGVDSHDKRLHAFADDHGEPLLLDHPVLWEKVKDAKTSPVTLVEIACGDHGADEEHSAVVTFAHGPLRIAHKPKKCP